MPVSLIVRASKEWTCVGCGEAIIKGMRYWRRRLAPVCLGCAEGRAGSHLGRSPRPPSQVAGCQRNGDIGLKKRKSDVD